MLTGQKGAPFLLLGSPHLKRHIIDQAVETQLQKISLVQPESHICLAKLDESANEIQKKHAIDITISHVLWKVTAACSSI